MKLQYEIIAICCALALAGGVGSGVAQAADPAKPDGDVKVAPLTLTPEEVAEREARKGCKIKICSAFLLKKAGSDVSCNVNKTLLKEQL